MKITILSIITSLLLVTGCHPTKKVSKPNKAEDAKQKDLRLNLASEVYLKVLLPLGGASVKADEKSIKEAKRRLALSKVPSLLLKMHKCETATPEYEAIKKCVLTTMHDISVLPTYFKASSKILGELMRDGLVTSQFQK